VNPSTPDLATAAQDTDVLVLAGGLGTRLRSSVSDRPKVMALVAGKPFLEWLVDDLRSQGVRRLVLCTGYRSEDIEDHFGSGRSRDMEIAYSRESAPLGTGGALRLALPRLKGSRFFVLNGDSLCDFDLRALRRLHGENSAAATLWLVPVEDTGRFGEVTLNARQEIAGFREKSGSGSPGLINAGVYLLERRVVESIAGNAAASLERDVLPGWVGRGLFGAVGRGPFLDIGTPESYRDAERFVKKHRI